MASVEAVEKPDEHVANIQNVDSNVREATLDGFRRKGLKALRERPSERLEPIRERGREKSALREKLDRRVFSGVPYKLVRPTEQRPSGGSMAGGYQKGSWTGVKKALRTFDAPGLVGVIRDLYDASPDNRRFLHARFAGADTELEKYRTLILDAVYPNLFGRKPVRIGEAQRLLRHFEQATGDSARTLDLMLTVVEAGTELAADTGHGDDAYFGSLEKTLSEAVERIRGMPAVERAQWQERLDGIVSRSASIGWGYCDATHDIVAALDRNRSR